MVEERTTQITRARGLRSELGILLPQSNKSFKLGVYHVLGELPKYCNQAVGEMLIEICRWEECIAQNEWTILQLEKEDVQAQRLMRLRGVGRVTATAIVASVGNGRAFCNDRKFSAWLWLVPRQKSSVGKAKLERITKAGDSYIRILLVLGARSMLINAKDKNGPVSRWNLNVWRASAAGKH